MTDREPTPAEEERVRRLLAQARHDEPMPPEVVARLDAVLRGLADERSEAPEAVREHPRVAHRAPVVDLAARRRRRRATSFLVAAAAVTVIGVGVPQILGDLSFSRQNDSATAGADGDADYGVPEAGRDTSGGLVDEGGKTWSLKRNRLSSDTFDHDVTELSGALSERSGTPTGPQDGTASPSEAATLDSGPGAYSACSPGVRQDVWGEGDLLWVRYDGRRAALVFRAPEGDTRQVDLFLCGETEPTRSTVVPVP